MKHTIRVIVDITEENAMTVSERMLRGCGGDLHLSISAKTEDSHPCLLSTAAIVAGALVSSARDLQSAIHERLAESEQAIKENIYKTITGTQTGKTH